MLTIDRLRLSLPPGYESRAGRIARLVADELAALPLTGDARFDRLTLPPLNVAPGASDGYIAGAIASAIAGQVNGAARGGKP